MLPSAIYLMRIDLSALGGIVDCCLVICCLPKNRRTVGRADIASRACGCSERLLDTAVSGWAPVRPASLGTSHWRRSRPQCEMNAPLECSGRLLRGKVVFRIMSLGISPRIFDAGKCVQMLPYGG